MIESRWAKIPSADLLCESSPTGFAGATPVATVLRGTMLLLCLAMASACTPTKQAPLRGVSQPVDLQMFMGDWYVHGYIPIHLPPLFSEKDAYNGVESYRLDNDGSIATTYTFRRGAFDGPEKRFTPRARVANPPINSEWKMKFFWYLPAGDFLILHVDPGYQTTIIGVPDRSYVWIMARDAALPVSEYEKLLDLAAGLGYDRNDVLRVPQSAAAQPASR
jgi:apolipoprotein D and lipocalin family protein